ncbi:MAG: hypothetical protein AMXMBFR23_17980 [Chloroflexota bacterium]
MPSRHLAAIVYAIGVLLLGSACDFIDAIPRPGGPTATPTPTFTAVTGSGSGVGEADDTPIIGLVDVWLGDYGLMAWQRRLVEPGRYQFNLQNFGLATHDLTVIRAPRGVASIPSRLGRVPLNEVDVVARSEVVEVRDDVGPGEATVLADLTPGRYVLISGEGRDFGRGMFTEIVVGGGNAGLEPDPMPESSGGTMAVYLVDHAIFTSRDIMDGGTVSLLIQNVGRESHDARVFRWRGSPVALPVEADRLLLDSLVEVGRVGILAPGDRATLEIEVDKQYAYVIVSTLGTDYAEGMRAQFFVR